MAKFELELPNVIIKGFEKLNKNIDGILGEMTKEGAEYVADNMKANAPSDIKPFVKTSKTYKTPSDGGINTKTYISGYLPFSNPNRSYFERKGGSGKSYRTNKGVPADFLAQLYEYGRSNAPFPKRPFMRKSFRKKEIERVMLNKQNKMFEDLFGASDFVSDWVHNLK